MKATKWLFSVIAMSLYLAPFNLTAQATGEITYEGYDRQSPEEIERARQEIEATFGAPDAAVPMFTHEGDRMQILLRYAFLDPMQQVPTDLLEKAVLYFDKNKSKFPNEDYMTIVDFKPRSDKARLFLINIKTGEVKKYHTSHGINSDKNKNGYAESFGNVINSGKSSLGFARVSEVYSGKFGRSIRLDGLSSTNSNIRARAVVFHGWEKTYERDTLQGLSWGCITMDYDVRDEVLDKIKEGSLMYVGVSGK
ncbi:MAG: murein L,D-transpeptidase catalytic domain family protein [Bdellovibrionales bacterium]|nr:murein L,D-transpeptidase catalytic domain family protein [Bdellovibrionales bacterium]